MAEGKAPPFKKAAGPKLAEEILGDMRKKKGGEAAAEPEGDTYAGDEVASVQEFYEAAQEGDWSAASAALKAYLEVCVPKIVGE